MELPPFEILWQTSEKLSELESILTEIDGISARQTLQPRKYRRNQRGGLFGVTFDVEDRTYYEPYKHCCDQAFYTQFEYDRHIENHAKCEVDGCSFVGCGRLMQFHIEVAHNKGTLAKAYRASSDPAVLEWREARKRNYPTLEKAAVKQELIARQIAHGQIFATPKSGALKRHRLAVVPAMPVHAHSAPSKSTRTKITPPVQVTSECPVAVPLPPDVTAGDASTSETHRPSSLVAYDCDSDTSAPNDEDSQEKPNETAMTTGCLPQSAAKSKENGTPRRPRVRRRRGGRGRRAKKVKESDGVEKDANNEEPDGDDEPELVDKATQNNDPFSSHPLVRMQAKRRAVSKEPNRIYSRPTLLHMLLAEEMRTERNHLMQCIRFVIKNNFFMDSTEEQEDGK